MFSQRRRGVIFVMIGRLIQTKIWTDTFFAELTPSEKLIFLYYLTNPLITIIHLYECPDRLVMFDTGIDKQILTNAKNKFQAQKKMYFHKDWVYLANASRYQRFSGESNEIAKARFFERLPKDVLDWFYSIKDTTPYPPVYSPYNRNHIRNSNIEKEEDIVEDYIKHEQEVKQ